MDLFTVSWTPEDHIDELCKILQDANVDDVEKQLVQYMVDCIEPTGWRAKWQYDNVTNKSNSPNITFSQDEYIVDVEEVSMDKLEAKVVIVGPVADFLKQLNSKEVEEQDQMDVEESNSSLSNNKKTLTVKVWELTPMVQQDNDTVDVTTTAEITQQLRFFYHHIYYPWDTAAEYCCYDEATIRCRYQIYQELTGSVAGLPAGVAADMLHAVREAWLTLHSIQQIEESSGVSKEGVDIEGSAVQQLMELHRKLDALKDRFELLRDPIMRELSSQHRALEMTVSSNSVLSVGSNSSGMEGVNRVWLVGTGASMAQLQLHLQQLTGVMQHYPQCASWPVSLSGALQNALDCSMAGDLLLLLPGTHQLHSLGVLAHAGGIIRGITDGAVVFGSASAGDVMMHISVGEGKKTKQQGFCLSHLTLRPQLHQTGILVHSGHITLDTITIMGGCKTGVVVTSFPSGDTEEEESLSGGLCEMTGCSVRGCQSSGVECRAGSKVFMRECLVEHCATGLTVSVGSKLELTSSKVNGCSSSAINLLWDDCSVDPTADKVDDLTPQQLLPCMLEEYRNVTLSDNTKELLMTYPQTTSKAAASSAPPPL